MNRTLFASLLLVVSCESGVPALPVCSTTICPTGQVCNPTTGACEVPPSRCSQVRCVSPLACDPNTGYCAFPLGALIDRAGRPLINHVLTNPFDGLAYAGVVESGAVTRERYNQDKFFPWAQWAIYFAQTLALYDGLDGICGNTFAPSVAGAARFSTIASLLAADAILVDTNKPCGTNYLAVESAAVSGQASTECGGRRLEHDVVDVTFTVLAGSPAGDLVPMANIPLGSFPYLP